MIVLIAFAFLAGAGTALSPCVLPVLPALLSAGAAGGRRRPLGVVLGLSITFTVTIVGVASVVDGVGLGSDPLRVLAIVVLLVFGLVLLMPRCQRPPRGAALAAGAVRAEERRRGLLVGDARRRRARVRVHAVREPDPRRGDLGQRGVRADGRARDRLRDRLGAGAAGAHARRALGVRARAPRRARRSAAARDGGGDGPDGRRDPDQPGRQLRPARRGTDPGRQPDGRSRVLEHASRAACTRSRATGRSSCPRTARRRVGARRARSRWRRRRRRRPRCWPRRTSSPPSAWRPNSRKPRTGSTLPGARPLSLQGLRGRVVLVDFWTYTCINCIRTLPYLKAWDAAYRSDGLTIVGVETPEFAFEHDAGNVSNAISQFGLRYPVVQDNQMGTWNAYGNNALAGRLPDRRPRAGPLRLDRRGRLRPDRNGDQSPACRTRRRARAPAGARRA